MAVVNDDVKKDADRQQLLTLCAPQGVNVYFWSVEEGGREAAKIAQDAQAKAILLFSKPNDVSRMIASGAAKPAEVNVGGMHYAMGRISLGRFVTFSDEDRQELLKLAQSGIKLDARATPHDNPVDLLPVLQG